MKYITSKHISNKHISKKLTAPLLCMALCGALTACGHKEPSHALSPEQTESQSTEAEPEIRIDTQRGSQSDKASEHPIGSGSTAATADSAQGEAGYRLIKDQTFDVALEPLGGVTFASYEPDSLQNPLADVMFEITKEGTNVCLLDGVYEDNIRSNETFNKVEAVSFPDYNSDGFNDIIIICSYSPASGPKVRFGPLKPRGLPDPKTGKEPYAVVQLRRDNADGTIYNLVGFQTHLRWPEQKRVFTMIPALKDAQFLRYGVMHRNTYLDSPRLLDRYYRLKSQSRIAFAGQMTGVEGYVESCASGFLVGVETARRLKGQAPIDFPQETAIGALGLYVSNQTVGVFQPMNINFGIIPPLDHRVKGKRNKNAELSQRSLAIIEARREEILS